jgi:hypothetical protein
MVPRRFIPPTKEEQEEMDRIWRRAKQLLREGKDPYLAQIEHEEAEAARKAAAGKSAKGQ